MLSSIAARSEHIWSARQMRRHATGVRRGRPHPSRRAHARPNLRILSASHCRARPGNPSIFAITFSRRRWMGGSSPRMTRFLLMMSNSPSRSRGAFLRPGFETLASRTRNEGWRSAGGRRVLARHPWPALGGRQGASAEAPCVPRRGTPASRRSHRGDFGPGARGSLTGLASGSASELLALGA